MFTLTFPFNSPTDWRLSPLDKLMALCSASAESSKQIKDCQKSPSHLYVRSKPKSKSKRVFELHFRNFQIASLTLPMITCRHRHHPGD